MGKLLGKMSVTIDGRKFEIENTATLNPGGIQRVPVMANGKVVGYREEDVAPELNANIIVDDTYSQKEVLAFTDSTVVVEFDTGQISYMRKAFTMEPSVIDPSASNAPLKMSCEEVEEA